MKIEVKNSENCKLFQNYLEFEILVCKLPSISYSVYIKYNIVYHII